MLSLPCCFTQVDSVFCFVGRGITLWTRRLFEAIVGGCVPVIVNDFVSALSVPCLWSRSHVGRLFG